MFLKSLFRIWMFVSINSPKRHSLKNKNFIKKENQHIKFKKEYNQERTKKNLFFSNE